jgi:hypothetical protein
MFSTAKSKKVRVPSLRRNGLKATLGNGSTSCRQGNKGRGAFKIVDPARSSGVIIFVVPVVVVDEDEWVVMSEASDDTLRDNW